MYSSCGTHLGSYLPDSEGPRNLALSGEALENFFLEKSEAIVPEDTAWICLALLATRKLTSSFETGQREPWEEV